MDTETENHQSTSVFRVDRITVADGGRWVCQVKTTSVQVEKDFVVSVKGEPSKSMFSSLKECGLFC